MELRYRPLATPRDENRRIEQKAITVEAVTTLFSQAPVPAQGGRHGKAWEPSDYELLVQGVREGLDEAALAEHIGRAQSVLPQRLRRMLPVTQRGCYPELVLPALREALSDPEYDWQAEMLLSPPPAPIIRNEIIRSGVDGLTDADLVIVAHALMAAGGRREEELLDQVTERLNGDGLMEAVIELRAQRAVRASPYSIDEDAAWAHASYWVRGRSYRPWRHAVPMNDRW